jgi:hypothetical protein
MQLSCHSVAWLCAQVFPEAVFCGFDPENPAVVAVYRGERAVMILLMQAPVYILRLVEPDAASRWSVVQGRLSDAVLAAITTLQSSVLEAESTRVS